jgi:VanZ family protein
VTSSASSLCTRKLNAFPFSAAEILLTLILLAVLPFFFVGAPAWMTTDIVRAFSNLAHIVVFALATLLVSGRIDLSHPRRWLLLTVIVVAISVVVELIQSQVGRSASWHDGLRNLTGTWLAIFWLQAPTATVWLGRIATALLLSMELGMVGGTIAAQQRMAAQLPLLSGMESSWDLERWQGIAGEELARSEDYATEGNYALIARLTTSEFSGISLTKMPNDWRAYNELSFDLYNPQDHELQITVRIHDADHEVSEARWRFADRFNQRLMAEPGWNRYRISLKEVEQAPEGRKMDLSLIKELRLFAAGLEEVKVIYADNFRFE